MVLPIFNSLVRLNLDLNIGFGSNMDLDLRSKGLLDLFLEIGSGLYLVLNLGLIDIQI